MAFGFCLLHGCAGGAKLPGNRLAEAVRLMREGKHCCKIGITVE